MRWDISDGPMYDLERNENRQKLLGWLRCGAIRGWHAGFPCSSFSRARDCGPGPRRLRSPACPAGLPDLPPADAAKVHSGNLLLNLVVTLADVSRKLQIPFMLENPNTSYTWKMPRMSSLMQKPGVAQITVSYCRWGTPWRKDTKFVMYLLDPATLEGFRCTGRKCCMTGEKHVQLRGLGPDRQFLTKKAEPYPFALCRRLALMFMNEEARARANTFARLTAGPV